MDALAVARVRKEALIVVCGRESLSARHPDVELIVSLGRMMHQHEALAANRELESIREGSRRPDQVLRLRGEVFHGLTHVSGDRSPQGDVSLEAIDQPLLGDDLGLHAGLEQGPRPIGVVHVSVGVDDGVEGRVADGADGVDDRGPGRRHAGVDEHQPCIGLEEDGVHDRQSNMPGTRRDLDHPCAIVRILDRLGVSGEHVLSDHDRQLATKAPTASQGHDDLRMLEEHSRADLHVGPFRDGSYDRVVGRAGDRTAGIAASEPEAQRQDGEGQQQQSQRSCHAHDLSPSLDRRSWGCASGASPPRIRSGSGCP